MEGETVHIDARGVYYKTLNEQVRQYVTAGAKTIVLDHVNGQRYIGAGLQGEDIRIDIYGVPGNDMAVFMDGPTIEVFDNAQDSVGNTMNAGRIYVHGHAGDVCGYGMRGGKLFVRGDVGYRVGIHMKAYMEKVPVLIIGGTAGHFLGEYMSGGTIILLGLEKRPGQPLAGDYLGTGMHGGAIFVRGEVDSRRVGKEVGVDKPDDAEYQMLKK
jgi:glutamate synthase domain-containing protein 3